MVSVGAHAHALLLPGLARHRNDDASEKAQSRCSDARPSALAECSIVLLTLLRMQEESQWPLFEAKMQAAGLSAAAIGAFKANYDQLVAGVTGMVSLSFMLSSVSAVCDRAAAGSP